MADFERARAHVYVGIVRGEPVDLEYLKMYPSENGEEDYRRRGFTFEVIDGELWMKKPDGEKFRCSIDGYARHPDYRHASELPAFIPGTKTPAAARRGRTEAISATRREGCARAHTKAVSPVGS